MNTTTRKLCVSLPLLGAFLTGCSTPIDEADLTTSAANVKSMSETETWLDRWEAELAEAEVAEQTGDLDQVAMHLASAVEAARQISSDSSGEAIAMSLSWLGSVENRRERFVSAEEHLRAAVRELAKSDSPDIELKLAVGEELATMLLQSQKTDEAVQHLEELHRECIRAGHQKQHFETLAQLLSMRISILVDQGDSASAAKAGDELLSMSLDQAEQTAEDLALLSCGVADLWHQAGQKSSAESAYASAVNLTMVDEFDHATAKTVYQACAEYCQHVGDVLGMQHFQQRIGSLDRNDTVINAANPTQPPGTAAPMSAAKQLAYQKVVEAKSRLDEVEEDWDEQYRRWGSAGALAEQYAGNASALGMYHGTFEAQPPDPYLRRSVEKTQRSYEEAVREFQATP